MNSKICPLCKLIFIPKSPRQIYCKKSVVRQCIVCGCDFTTECSPDARSVCNDPSCKKKAGSSGSIRKERICKICGQKFIPISARQQYCNQLVNRVCEGCGNKFTIKCTSEQYKIKTCSTECQNKVASLNRQKSYMQATKICELCGKEFHPRSNTQKICENKHFRKCIVCGKEFELNYKSGMNQSEFRKTCSEECNNKLHSDNNPFRDVEIRNKIKQTMLRKYGVEHPSQDPRFIQKGLDTYRAKTGYDHPAHDPNRYKGKFMGSSSLERKLETILLNNKVEYQTQKLVNKDNIYHSFDFYLPKYKLYIDVDGDYYHGYLDDSNGLQVSEDRDSIRTYLICSDEQYFVVTESNFNSDIDELINIIRNIDTNSFNYEEYMFTWCRSIEFPYPSYTDIRLTKDFVSLCRYNRDKYDSHAKLGLSSIRQFHKSIYDAKVGNNISIKEAWFNDSIIKKVIRNRMLYKNNVDPSKILSGFYISKIVPKISIFNPVLARYLTLKYLSEFTSVIDPFSGYSGRLLGVTSAGKRYIGHDINHDTVDESNQIINFHKLDASVSPEDIMLKSDITNGQCILTCPPYSKKETYGSESVYMTCDEWINVVLQKYSCSKYVFVVDNTVKYKDYISEEIVTKSYFNDVTEYVVVIERT